MWLPMWNAYCPNLSKSNFHRRHSRQRRSHSYYCLAALPSMAMPLRLLRALQCSLRHLEWPNLMWLSLLLCSATRTHWSIPTAWSTIDSSWLVYIGFVFLHFRCMCFPSSGDHHHLGLFDKRNHFRICSTDCEKKTNKIHWKTHLSYRFDRIYVSLKSPVIPSCQLSVIKKKKTNVNNNMSR